MKSFFSTLCCLILCLAIPGSGLMQTAADAATNVAAKKKNGKKKKKGNAQRKPTQRKKAKRRPMQRKRRPMRKNSNNRRRRPGMNKKRPNNKRNTNRNNNRKSNKKKNANRNRPANNKKRRSSNDSAKREPVEKQLLVHVKTWKETQAMIAKDKGKVVVVDLWATWCQPCVKELPHLVALQKKYPDDVVTYSYNVNYDGLKGTSLEEIRVKVKAFLTTHKAIDVKNIVSRDSDEKTFAAANIDSIPTILVYDRTGKLHRLDEQYAVSKKDKGLSYEKHVVPLVEKLVKQK